MRVTNSAQTWWMLLPAAIAAAAMMTASHPCSAQHADSASKLPSFEVVSIRRHQQEDFPPHFDFTTDGYVATKVQLPGIIASSYGVDDPSRIVGMPSWSAQRYDIQAKVADSDVAAFKKLTLDQHRQMVQAMLAARFKLKVHMETRQVPVYELIVAKTGSRLHEGKSDDTLPNAPKDPAGHPLSSFLGNMGPGEIVAKMVSMDSLAGNLGRNVAGRPVLNKTGLAGKYSFVLKWTPDPDQETGPGGLTPLSPNSGSFFTALQEQLGLTLRPAKGPQEFLVIDHIEQPTEN